MIQQDWYRFAVIRQQTVKLHKDKAAIIEHRRDYITNNKNETGIHSIAIN